MNKTKNKNSSLTKTSKIFIVLALLFFALNPLVFSYFTGLSARMVANTAT